MSTQKNTPSVKEVINLFGYDIVRVRETEKAILIKVKVYKNKEGKEEFLDVWLPKSILNNKQKIREFIEKAVKEKNKKFIEWMQSKGYSTKNITGYRIAKPKKITNIRYSISPSSPKPKGIETLWGFIIPINSPAYNDEEIFTQEIKNKLETTPDFDVELGSVYYFNDVELLKKIIEKYPNLYIKTEGDSALIVEEDYHDFIKQFMKEHGKEKTQSRIDNFKNKHGYSYEETYMTISDIKIKKQEL